LLERLTYRCGELKDVFRRLLSGSSFLRHTTSSSSSASAEMDATHANAIAALVYTQALQWICLQLKILQLIEACRRGGDFQ
uniref:GCP_C_terminal domain-containing protein n=1 Tax=Macrostomum lignano TaxID=282301 RepID=A0A1I8HN79_9PLAT